ncbi:enhancer of polycomb-like-domain-containing protein [Vararia minispora EC-137]|uniref:Enhancer of polycomb-like-domain-containing protein n=1 Tax=Vararia minispora EC-137 TaxID=1314806 RepID=A0ACB8QZX0_9AGAM|nr:enhancer of polycomb-like-domain-containing protein [Vararia minispora EC-137]
MPRNHAPGPSTLRNRNRVTNKTRLRVIKGNVEGDPLAFDEDEEKARVVSTAGVDAEDANEHHLQAVLSASSIRHQQNLQRATRGAEKNDKQPDAYIPIPDNTGLVDDYERFYPAATWTDPSSFVKTSATAEEAVSAALIDGFTYYMDERDKEWLDKNNEEARGEGTSVQGAVSAAGTRTSQRSAKARGKEPEHSRITPITEDEFELVMGIFEKVTHDMAPFLHHCPTEKPSFPSFPEYQKTFETPLPPSMFAVFVVPSWVPQPAHLRQIAEVIYPYWKERRTERGVYRVIPTLNFDEQDVKNESYICFRRRDVKAMRKTRASQASSSEKLHRLQQELASVQELSKSLCVRETLKRDQLQSQHTVWESREKLVDLKRQFPSLATKEDDELFVDKERPPKRPKVPEPRIKIPAKLPKESSAASAIPTDETIMKPKERESVIAKRIEQELQLTRERDQMWDDAIDNSYQPVPPTLGQRFFKFVHEKPPPVEERVEEPSYRAVRTRRGRGGVLRFDRRATRAHPSRDEDFVRPVRQPLEAVESAQDRDDTSEWAWRLRSQWMHDGDDEPHLGPDGPDEQDRVLVDEFNTTVMRKTMRLFTERDNQAMQTDPSLHWSLVDGTRKLEQPFKIGGQPFASGSGQQGQMSAQQPSGIPIANPQASPPMTMQTPIRRSSSSMGAPMRISSSTPMRPPATPSAPPMPATPTHASPPRPTASSPVNSDSHLTVLPALPQDISISTSHHTGDSGGLVSAPLPPKPSASHAAITMPNGFHMNSMNGYTAALVNGAGVGVTMQNGQQVGIQQLSAYMNMNGSRPAAYIGPNSVNYSVPAMNLKLPTARQMQWTTAQGAPGVPNAQPNVAIAHSRTQGSFVNGMNGLNGGHGSPPRTSHSPSMQHQQVVESTSGY